MQHIQVTLVGVVVSEVFHFDEGAHEVASFRMVSRPRRFDVASGQAHEGEPSFVSVITRRALAAHVAQSVSRGDPVLVTGRLRVRERDVDGQIKVRVEVDANTVGHDLGRGTATFTRTHRRASHTLNGEAQAPNVSRRDADGGGAVDSADERRTVA